MPDLGELVMVVTGKATYAKQMAHNVLGELFGCASGGITMVHVAVDKGLGHLHHLLGHRDHWVVMGSVEWVHMGGGGEGVCVELVVLGTGRYPCRCWVAQLMVSVLPSSTLMQMAKTLSSGSCSLVVKALRAHTRCALEAASLPTLLLVQHQVMEAMNSRVLRGILVPCTKMATMIGGWGRACGSLPECS